MPSQSSINVWQVSWELFLDPNVLNIFIYDLETNINSSVLKLLGCQMIGKRSKQSRILLTLHDIWLQKNISMLEQSNVRPYT